MQKKIISRVGLGFLVGFGLASCATPSSPSRHTAGDSLPRYSNQEKNPKDQPPCQMGEERNKAGECERPFTFDRPFRRGGR